MRGSQTVSAHRDLLFTLLLAWLVFVVYGSLVPLEFQRVPWAAAWERFSRIELLDVGVQGRGDWISNGVLYVPVGLLSMLLLVQGLKWSRWLAAGATAVLACSLAVGVEFMQLFFPPRTVSLNDLLAEGLGVLMGIALGWSAPVWWPALERFVGGKAEQLQTALLPVMLAAVLLLSLFPFDFLLSAQELSDKLHGGLLGWWQAASLQAAGALAWLARWGAELVITVPLGFWWARTRQNPSKFGLTAWLIRGFVAGAVVGACVELAQLLIASGVSQGASVLSRAAGWALGAVLWQWRGHWVAADWRASLQRHVLWLALLHVSTLVMLSGWLSGEWRSPDAALARLTGEEIRFVPFYYHYYTSEAVALQSLLSVALLYAPIGVLGWALGQRTGLVAAWAGGLALLMELGKLFPAGARPDPTNVGIAAAAAALTLLGLRWLSSSPGGAPSLGVVVNGATPQRGRLWATAWVVLAVAVATVWLVNFPMWRVGVGLLLLLATVVVWLQPVALLGVVVLALPLLNLSLWSGWEYVDEFDLLLALCLVAATASQRAAPRTARGQDALLVWLLWGGMACMALAAVVGWAPWQPAALSEPGSPLSPWGALKIFKGAGWAMVIYLVVRRQWAVGWPVSLSFSAGMVLGLLGVSAWVMWERAVFVGLWDASFPYRVAGPIVPMRTGGAYLDVFLIASLAFSWGGVLHDGRASWRLLCGLALLGGLYAVAVTYTRTTYLAAIVVILMLFILSVARIGHRLGRWPWVAGLLCMAPVVLLLNHFIAGSFAQSRWAAVQQDLNTRWAHLHNVVDVAQASGHNFFWGRGLGRYPADHYWLRAGDASDGGRVAVHAFTSDGGQGLLQIGPGKGLYVDQAMELPKDSSITIGLRARSAGDGGRLRLMVCEKWLLASAECVRAEVVLPAAQQSWVMLSSNLNLATLQGSDRPIRFSLANSGEQRVELDSVSLRDSKGVEWLRNGTFEAGGEHWTYTADDHLAWHVKNMPLAVWYQSGLLGVLSLGALLLLALVRGTRAALHGQQESSAMLSALAGLLVAAVFDAVVDDSRFLLILLILLWLLAMRSTRPGRPVKARAA